MIYRIPCPPEAVLVPTTYQFLAPTRMRVRRPCGKVELMGYGIGETLEVMEPATQYLIPCYDLLKEIPLTDGSFVVEFNPDEIRMERVRK